jgi:hypothetical protein
MFDCLLFSLLSPSVAVVGRRTRCSCGGRNEPTMLVVVVVVVVIDRLESGYNSVSSRCRCRCRDRPPRVGI